MDKKILVCGGAGYIGSHVCIALINSGYDVHIIDNFSRSNIDIVDKLSKITKKNISYSKIDIYTEKFLIDYLFSEHSFYAIIHLAGLKVPSESIDNPLLYYNNNVVGTLNLLEAMQHKCNRIIFSSSATVYGFSEKMPVKEDFPTNPTNPYGKTKLMVEQILSDIKNLKAISLRYFNPVGCYSPEFSEDLKLQIPCNLFPYITKVIKREFTHLNIFGGDWNTPDGTCIRDFIHIMDLAAAHVAAVAALERLDLGHRIYNIGTGIGYSIMDVIETFKKLGVEIPYKIIGRRPGDIGVCYSSTKLANDSLGWKATKSLLDMCRDSMTVQL